MRRSSALSELSNLFALRVPPGAAELIARPSVRLALFFVLTTLGLTLVLAFQLLPSRFQFAVGEVAQTTIKSPVQVTFVSESQTQLARAQAAAAVSDVVRFDPASAASQVRQATEILGRVTTAIEDPTLDQERRATAIRNALGPDISQEAIDTMASWDAARWRTVLPEVLRLVNEILRSRLTEAQLPDVPSRLGAMVNTSVTGDASFVAVELAASLIRPNVVRDAAATEAARERARSAVDPVRVSIEKGEVILRDGEVVSELALEKLAAAGLLDQAFEWTRILGMAVFSALVALALTGYLGLIEPKIVVHERRLLLIGVVIVLTVLAAKLTIPGRELYAYIFPFAAAPMLIAVLLGGPLAIITSVALGLLVGFVAGGSVELIAIYVLSGLFGAYVAWQADRLNRLFLAGLAAALGNFLIVFGFGLWTGDADPGRLALYAFLALVSGGLAAALAIGAITLLGHVFAITTHVHLLELAHPNQPLLKMLMTNAPGTYQHSVIVANLAERAAESIGADALLCRVGAYYHDIGKALRPGYFVENQLDCGNVHDHLDPHTSARLIASHVIDGYELAKKHRLPPKIRDFIPEHHGTRMVSFFYHKAQQEQGYADVKDFQYPGPKPRSRETAILMLADSIEAWVRSMKDRSPEKIDETVDRLVSERVAEGQLDDSDLTLRDLQAIREAFKAVLRSVYHPRIEYPTTVTPPNAADQPANARS